MRQANPVLLKQLKADYLAAKQLGSPVLACQFMLVPRDFEGGRLLIKSGPVPIVSNADSAEIIFAGGTQSSVAGVPNNKYESSLSVIETEAGHARNFAELIVAKGGCIDCDLYQGRPGSYTHVYELLDCKIRLETGEFDSESRSQNLTFSGQMDFAYFGDYANVGASGTVMPGQRGIEGVDDLIQRVQDVINVAQNGTNLARQATNFVRGLGSLFG